MISELQFIHFLTATLLIDLFFLFAFKIVNRKGKKWISINNWYNNLKWTAVILDVLSIMIGFYISKLIYDYLLKNNYITIKNEFIIFILIVLIVQIIHDFGFYFLVIKQVPYGKNRVIDEFKSYANIVGINAVIGDSLMYIFATPILYFIIQNTSNNVNIFTSLVSLYLIGYLIHQ
tara:strand:+ start:258 stop:785 length:528 start_codon:yes stop_codon:yes gene_type:complete